MPAKVYIETYGCAFNAADGEALAGVLEGDGFQLAQSEAQADAVILNTCTVKDRTYLNFEKRLDALRRRADSGEGPVVVLAGCIPKANRAESRINGIAALGPDTIAQAGKVVRAALAGIPLQHLKADGVDAKRDRLRLQSRRRNPAVEILPISSGCLSACTFCQTRLARGRLVSFRPGDILDRARRAIAGGVTQIWITSQDTGVYGRDCGGSLARLLDDLGRLDGDFRVRLGMSSPIWIWESLDEILDALAHPKMFKFLHVPVQSGSDTVLAAMNRGNTAAQFIQIADAFYARFPDGTLMTDLIVGYPTETEVDFRATLDVVGRARPVASNRSRFSPRPGTPAALLAPLPTAVIRERSLRLAELVTRLAADYHARQVGKTEEVVTGERKVDGTTIAHNDAWRPVVLRGRLPLGRWLTVKYTSAREFHLKGEIVSVKPAAAHA